MGGVFTLFVFTSFLSALLLFWIQPMTAKALLPFLGGVPSVWNTCMVFFQATLLAGYGYAYLMARRLSVKQQALAHCSLLILAVCFLPFGSPVAHRQSQWMETHPALWLLGALCTGVGFPFFVLSSNAPLLQQWLAQTRLEAARNPYALYSASNLGSLAGLLGYPILMEPHLNLSKQKWAWAIGYGCLTLMIAVCLAIVWRSVTPDKNSDLQHEPSPAPSDILEHHSHQSNLRTFWKGRLRWMALAFVPSSLLLGVTTYLTTDIASIPLLWIIPLSIYLLTFILVFARRRILNWQRLLRPMPILAVTLTFFVLSRATQPILLLISVHLLFFFAAGMVCHGQLADERPPPARLTEFYFCLSLGGVVGSSCVALMAPIVFKSVAEYPFAVVLACLLRPTKNKLRWQWLDVAFPILLAMLAVCLVTIAPVFDWNSAYLRNALTIGVPLIIAFTFVDRPIRFALGLGAIMLGVWGQITGHGRTIHVERNFFGVSRVTRTVSNSAGTSKSLIHGNTLHGRQWTDGQRECEPLTYYHRTGPAGDIFNWLNSQPTPSNVAMVGLGAGSTGGYAASNQEWTFYEIDPAVMEIAQNTNYFTFLKECTRAKFKIVAGDARLRLREAPNEHFRLIVLDAFSSDAIPVHLLTREALKLYLSKLAPGGVLAFHISNRCLDLEPVLGALAKDAGLVCRSADDANLRPDELAAGKEESQWVLLTRRAEDLAGLNKNPRWLPVDQQPGLPVWTDDFSNIFSVFKWK